MLCVGASACWNGLDRHCTVNGFLSGRGLKHCTTVLAAALTACCTGVNKLDRYKR